MPRRYVLPIYRRAYRQRSSRLLLDHPTTSLVREIDRYISTHAPAGSWHKAVSDAEAERPDEA